MGEKWNAYGLLMGKRPLGRPRWRWVDNIMIDLGDIGWDCVGCIDLPQDREKGRTVVNSVMNLRFK
jgi:hypothetical protein